MTTNRKRYVKKEIGTVSNFIDHIKFHLICGIVGKIWVVESERAISMFRKRKGKFLCYLLHKWVREIRNLATTAKKVQKSVMHVQSFCFANRELKQQRF